MAIFVSAAANKSQPLSLDYVDAATMVNLDCGPGFVNGTIPSVGSSGSGSGSTSAAGGGCAVGSIPLRDSFGELGRGFWGILLSVFPTGFRPLALALEVMLDIDL